jgi:hypothetical protein
MYKRMKARPDNPDSPAARKVKEEQLSTAFLQYLACTESFADWKGNEELFEQRMVCLDSSSLHELIIISQGRDPIAVWVALRTAETAELADFALTILKIVVNQAGCERVFSDLKVKQTQRRNRLKLEKLDKMTKVSHAVIAFISHSYAAG